MAIQYMDAVLRSEHIDDKGEAFVLLALANYTDERGICWPSIEVIAKRSRHKRRATINILARLRGVYVDWDENSGGRNKRNRYQLNLNAIKDKAVADKLKLLKVKGASDALYKIEKPEAEKGASDAGKGASDDTEKGASDAGKGALNAPAIKRQEPSIKEPSEPDCLFFLDEEDEKYRRPIQQLLHDFPDNNAVAVILHVFEWKQTRYASRFASLARDYGFVIYCAAVVIAASTKDAPSPIKRITDECNRLHGLRSLADRKKRTPPRPLHSPSEFGEVEIPDDIDPYFREIAAKYTKRAS